MGRMEVRKVCQQDMVVPASLSQPTAPFIFLSRACASLPSRATLRLSHKSGNAGFPTQAGQLWRSSQALIGSRQPSGRFLVFLTRLCAHP